ncbi:tyrosine-type recombinase/integrase [Microvirga terrae]|uniref:tyrosine-type recombinase/integrase n=1 Tax=Microvirga terrae TaxID=2740529 RepID=UPI003D81B7F9
MPALVQRLRRTGSISALCLEFTILTAARSGEAVDARWDELELERGIWTVPPARMKAGREHRVPLPARAKIILDELA